MKTISITILLLCLATFLHAQVAEVLAGEGFENIQTLQADGRTYVTFEDNVYRGTYTGVDKALQLILTSLPEGESLDVVVADLGLPQLHIAIDTQTVEKYRKGQILLQDVYSTMVINDDYDESWRLLKRANLTRFNSSSWKFDFVMYPQLMLDNSSTLELYDYYLNIAPAMEMSLWKGAKLTLQAVVPIATNMSGQYNKIRAGFLTIEQNFHLPCGYRLRFVAGNFGSNRAGAQIEGIWHSKDGRTEFGAKVAETVQSIVTNSKGWTFSKKLRATLCAYAKYYVPQFNTELKIQGNRYVYGDCGVRGDIIRHFGETTIGIYGMYVKKEFNGGFDFTVPLPGKKFMPHRAVRIRPAYNMDFDYSLKTIWEGYNATRNVAQTFKVSPDENASHRYYQPDYIRYFLIRNATQNVKLMR